MVAITHIFVQAENHVSACTGLTTTAADAAANAAAVAAAASAADAAAAGTSADVATAEFGWAEIAAVASGANTQLRAAPVAVAAGKTAGGTKMGVAVAVAPRKRSTVAENSTEEEGLQKHDCVEVHLKSHEYSAALLGIDAKDYLGSARTHRDPGLRSLTRTPLWLPASLSCQVSTL